MQQLGEMQRGFMGGAVGLAGAGVNQGQSVDEALRRALGAMGGLNQNPFAGVPSGQQPPAVVQPPLPPARQNPGPVNPIPGAPPPFAPLQGAQLPPPNPAMGAQLFPGLNQGEQSVAGLLDEAATERVPGAAGRPAENRRVSIDDFMKRLLASRGADWVNRNIHEIMPYLQGTYTGTGAPQGRTADYNFNDWWNRRDARWMRFLTPWNDGGAPNAGTAGPLQYHAILADAMRARNPSAPGITDVSTFAPEWRAAPIPPNIRDLLTPR
jgi:hypothetical protein